MFEDVINNENVRLYIQWVDNVPFLHCRVYNWKLSTYKLLWQEYMNLITTYGKVYSYIPKDSNTYKFNTLFGMTLKEETEQGYLMESRGV